MRGMEVFVAKEKFNATAAALVDTACASIAAFLRGDELTYQV